MFILHNHPAGIRSIFRMVRNIIYFRYHNTRFHDFATFLATFSRPTYYTMIVSNITISFILMNLQILFTIYLLYRMKQAIDYNYALVLEKTHQTPRKITSDGDTGTQFTFYF